MRRLLQDAGVEMSASKSDYASKKPHLYVDQFDADEAVARWARLELPEHAAARLGIAGSTLRGWLRQAGHVSPGRRVPWRLEPELLAAVYAAHRPAARVAA
jgi:hypothetical protein